MSLSCIMSIGVFCFGSWAGGPAIATNPKDTSAFLSISAKGWTIRADEKAKLKAATKPAAMTEACADAKCISYARTCDSAEHPTRCEYLVEVGGVLHTVSLNADNEDSARIAMANFAVLTAVMVSAPGATLPPNLALTELNKETARP